MKKLLILLLREYYEHRGMLVKTPLLLALAVFTLVTIGVMTGVGGSPESDQVYQLLSAHDKVRLIMNSAYAAAFAPMLLLQAIVMLYYSVIGLYDERRNKSILFWKSIPASDALTVFSKLLMATLLWPICCLLIGLGTAYAIMMVMTVNLYLKGIPLFSALWASPLLIQIPAEALGMIPVFWLWSLPTAGWLFLISGWARSKVMLWAFGVPLLLIATFMLVRTLYAPAWDANWLIEGILARALDGAVPGAWSFHGTGDMTILFDQNQALTLSKVFQAGWRSLLGFELWLGAFAGLGMLILATRMRKYHAEA